MNDSLLFSLLQRFCQRDIVNATFKAILHRLPAVDELKTSQQKLSSQDGFNQLLRSTSSSDEAWLLAIKQHSEELVTRFVYSLLGRVASKNEQDHFASGIQETGNFDALLGALIQSDEMWEQTIKRRSHELVSRFFTGLLERAPSEEEYSHYSHQIEVSGSFDGLLNALIQSDEALAYTIKQHAADVVGAIYCGITKQTASEALLGTYSSQLAFDGKIADITQSISHSDAAWSTAIQAHWPKLVDTIFRHLLHQAPTADDVANFLGEGLDGTLALVGILEEVRRRQQILSLEAKDEQITIAYQVILERDPDDVGLAAFRELCSTSADLNVLLQRLISSEEYRIKQFNYLKAPLVDAITQIYQKKQHIREKITAESSVVSNPKELVSAFVRAIEPDYIAENDYYSLRQRPNSDIPVAPRLESPRRLALIFVLNESWLAFCITVADSLRESDGVEAVLVWWEWSPAIAQAFNLSPNVYEVIGYQQLLNLPVNSQFKPRMLVLHSYGFADMNLAMLNRFKDAKLIVYADCYKNEIDSVLNEHRSIVGGFYFGFQPDFRRVLPYKIIENAQIGDAIDKVADFYTYRQSPNNALVPLNPYAMVYIRYWGIGPYAFNLDMATDIMVATIVKGVDVSLELVLKNDARAQPELLALLTEKLHQKGYRVNSINAYLELQSVDPACSALPVEFLLSKGLLCDAACHVVFDSSLSYLIASSRHIKPNATLVVGADLSLIPEQIPYTFEEIQVLVDTQLMQERGVAPRSYEAAITTIRLYSKHYADAIISTIEHVELIDMDNIAYYSFRLIGRMLQDE